MEILTSQPIHEATIMDSETASTMGAYAVGGTAAAEWLKGLGQFVPGTYTAQKMPGAELVMSGIGDQGGPANQSQDNCSSCSNCKNGK